MIQLDTAFDAVVNEISELTGLDKALVQRKVWAEALNNGVNVCEEARYYKVIPHIYDTSMEALYREGYGFIFETMVEGCRQGKQSVLHILTERIQAHAKSSNLESPKVLMLGDGCGSDTLHLVAALNHHLEPWYFDVGESKTFDFAQRRFRKRGIRVQVVQDVEDLPRSHFDVVVCLEVLEHLPKPSDAIATIERVLKIGGITLITESFSAFSSKFPTHLRSNLRFIGRSPFMFLGNNLHMTFFNTDPQLAFRPTEFIRLRQAGIKEKLRLITNSAVLKQLIKGQLLRTRMSMRARQ